eukprot:g31913.t1
MTRVGNITALKRIVSYLIVSYRIISYRIISYRIVSYRIISYHILSYRILSYRIVSYRIVSYRLVSSRLVSYCIVLYHIVSYRIVSYRIISYHIVSSCIVSYHIVSYCIISYHIVSYRIVSYRIVAYRSRIVAYRIVSYHIVSYRIVSYRISLTTLVVMGKRKKVAARRRVPVAKRAKARATGPGALSQHCKALPAGAQLLVVGDGDFSFSQSLCALLRHGVAVTATGLDSHNAVVRKYPQAAQHIQQVRAHGAHVLHGLDATQLPTHFPQQSFDRIIFNFPHSGQQRVHINRALLRDFFRSATDKISSNGKVLLTLKDKPPYCNWQMEEAATAAGLIRESALRFDAEAFPHYAHVTTDPTHNDVEYRFVKTFVFARKSNERTVLPIAPGWKDDKEFGIWGRIRPQDSTSTHQPLETATPVQSSTPSLASSVIHLSSFSDSADASSTAPSQPFRQQQARQTASVQRLDLTKIETIVPDFKPSPQTQTEHSLTTAALSKLNPMRRGYLTWFQAVLVISGLNFKGRDSARYSQM